MIKFREIGLAEYPPIDPHLPMGTPQDNLRQQSRTLQRKEPSLHLSAPFARTPAQTPKLAKLDATTSAMTAEKYSEPSPRRTQNRRKRQLPSSTDNAPLRRDDLSIHPRPMQHPAVPTVLHLNTLILHSN